MKFQNTEEETMILQVMGVGECCKKQVSVWH